MSFSVSSGSNRDDNMARFFRSRTPQPVAPAGPDAPAVPSLKELGLDHLTLEQRVGLRDDVLAGFYNNTTRELFTGFDLSKDDVLIDVGCGGGGPLEFCARHAGTVHAVDVHQDTVDGAKQHLIDRGIDVSHMSFTVSDGASLPFESGLATRVICLEVLEHVDSPMTVMNELVRVAAPGALLLISVPDQRGEDLLHHYAPAAAWKPPHHIRTFGVDELADLIERAGLEIVERATSGFFRLMWLAMYWTRTGHLSEYSHAAIEPETVENDELIGAWVDVWMSILDRPDGPQIKRALDGLLPKSQLVLARKPRGER